MQTTPQDKIKRYQELGWWGDDTLTSLLLQALEKTPDQEALIDPPNREHLVGGQAKRLTFGDIDKLSDDLAHLFYESGLRQGEKIVVQMPNVVEIVLTYFAASKLGIIISPVAMQYGQFELAHIDEVISPDAYLAFTEFRGEIFGGIQSECFRKQCTRLIIDGVSWIEKDTTDRSSFERYLQNIDTNANDIFTICWTSGTTGRSKGVPRSYNHWLSSTLASEDAIRLDVGATMLNPFPFINMAAIGGFLFYWLRLGAKMILHQPFDARLLLSQIQDEKVHYTVFPPAVLTQLLHTKEQIKDNYDLSCLAIVGSGSAPLTPAMISGFKSEFGVEVINIFGSNEGMSLLSDPIDVPDSIERASFFPRFGRSEFHWDNRISAQIRTKLIDIETGQEIIEQGSIGECLLQGPTVFDGYYNSPGDNSEAFSSDGYFRSGDLFEIVGDRNQYYRFVGRRKSLILRGGVNISPEELDELLNRHDSIAEGAVASYPDDVLGEKICAFVSLKVGKALSLDQLKDFMQDLGVAKFKWPERLQIIDSLPRNAMNKVDRGELQKKVVISDL
ncbi:MAG: 2,3-dihydroxybenzoate-AMP ligase [Flammeovirgaceae bacterium]|nr:2,3-dihydroxybenzoate-AMP ligase [Flammeovirgaceae bacterium]